MTGLSAETLALAGETSWEVEARQKGPAEVCGCGHTMAKHSGEGDRARCNHGRTLWCPCRVPLAVLRVPNARHASYKTGPDGHAVMKLLGKLSALGLAGECDWVARCSECGADPVCVVALADGKVNVPRCGEHR